MGDTAAAKQLNNFGRAAAVALTELKQAQMAAAEACGSLEIMAALALVDEQEALIQVWVQKINNACACIFRYLLCTA